MMLNQGKKMGAESKYHAQGINCFMKSTPSLVTMFDSEVLLYWRPSRKLSTESIILLNFCAIIMKLTPKCLTVWDLNTRLVWYVNCPKQQIKECNQLQHFIYKEKYCYLKVVQLGDILKSSRNLKWLLSQIVLTQKVLLLYA